MVVRPASGASRNYQYINFYKYHYARLMQEHSRWTPAQIVQIIKLEWKKRRMQAKGRKIAKRAALQTRRLKPVSGKVFFGRSRLLDHKARDRLWRRLPYESRVRYVQWSMGEDGSSRRRMEQVVWRSKRANMCDFLNRK